MTIRSKLERLERNTKGMVPRYCHGCGARRGILQTVTRDQLKQRGQCEVCGLVVGPDGTVLGKSLIRVGTDSNRVIVLGVTLQKLAEISRAEVQPDGSLRRR